MRKVVRIGSLFLLMTSAMIGYAQQYPVFTQYYFNELVINPAYAGAHVQLSLTSSYRNQWVNFFPRRAADFLLQRAHVIIQGKNGCRAPGKS
jgi:hypothetical protein